MWAGDTLDVLTSSAPLSLLTRYSTVVLGAPPTHDTTYLASMYAQVGSRHASVVPGTPSLVEPSYREFAQDRMALWAFVRAPFYLAVRTRQDPGGDVKRSGCVLWSRGLSGCVCSFQRRLCCCAIGIYCVPVKW